MVDSSHKPKRFQVPTKQPGKLTRSIPFDNLRTLPQAHPMEELLGLSVDKFQVKPPAESEPSADVSLTPNSGPPSDVALPLYGGPPVNSGPPLESGPPRRGGPTKKQVVALQNGGPPLESGPPPESGLPSESLLNSLPGVDGHTQWYNEITDYLFGRMTPNEQAVYMQLFRLTWGFDRPRCIINFPRLGERSGMSENGARLAAKGLIAKGLIRKLGMIFGSNREQGIEWEVYEPPARQRHRATRRGGPPGKSGPTEGGGPPPGAAMKGIESKIEQAQTQDCVSGGSRFSLEECRRYADHLKAMGQGITNPGGYATKIFRSGEADALIESFLKPTLDINQCPDCRGMGVYYPNGIGNGPVVKCKHEKLRGLNDGSPSRDS